jgi:hypothetical protein
MRNNWITEIEGIRRNIIAALTTLAYCACFGVLLMDLFVWRP